LLTVSDNFHSSIKRGLIVNKKRILCFLVAFATIAVMELLPWEIRFNDFQDQTGGFAAETITNLKNDVQAWDVGPGLTPEPSAQNSAGANPKASASFLDPVTMLLLGSGLIGLAGLGRNKA
jgi:hypothetical protein